MASISRMSGAKFADAIVDRVTMAVAAGKRVAYWGHDPDVFGPLAQLAAFRHSDFCLVSESEDDRGVSVCGRQFATPDVLMGFQPDAVVVLDPAPQLIFERLLALGFEPSQIMLPEFVWEERLVVSDVRFEQTISSIPKTIAGGLSGREVTIHTFDALRYISEQEISGDVVNFGVFQGWSMYFCAAALRLFGDAQSRSFVGFDTFAGFVPTEDKYDRFVAHQCGLGKTGWNFYKNTSREAVAANLSTFNNVELIKGDIRQTIGRLRGRKVAFALFDMDDYVPTKAALKPTYDALVPRGVFVFDHFSYHTLADGSAIGQRVAMSEFLKTQPMFNLTGTNVFLR
jgi:Macrocin-O-methyltransferase (TylF)